MVVSETKDFIQRLSKWNDRISQRARQLQPDQAAAALSGIAAAMVRVLERVTKRRNWEFAPRGGGAIRLRPSQWAVVSQELGYLDQALTWSVVTCESRPLEHRGGRAEIASGPSSHDDPAARTVAELGADRAALREIVQSMQAASEAWLAERAEHLLEDSADRHSVEKGLDALRKLRLDAHTCHAADTDAYSEHVRRWSALFTAMHEAV